MMSLLLADSIAWWIFACITAVVVFGVIIFLVMKLNGDERGKPINNYNYVLPAEPNASPSFSEPMKRGDEDSITFRGFEEEKEDSDYDKDKARIEQEKLEEEQREREKKSNTADSFFASLEDSPAFSVSTLNSDEKMFPGSEDKKDNKTGGSNVFFGGDEVVSNETNYFSEPESVWLQKQADTLGAASKQEELLADEETADNSIDPRIQSFLNEFENQKQDEMQKFADMMSELNVQKESMSGVGNDWTEEAADDNNLKGQLLVEQARSQMAELVRSSRERYAKNVEKIPDELEGEMQEILNKEKQEQEKRLKIQEEKLNVVLAAIAEERRAAEEKQAKLREEEKRAAQFEQLRKQYLDAINVMQVKYEEALEEMKKNRTRFADEEIEREKKESTVLIEKMKEEIAAMSKEREEERKQFIEDKEKLDRQLVDALEKQRIEYQDAEGRIKEMKEEAEREKEEMRKKFAMEREEFLKKIKEQSEAFQEEIDRQQREFLLRVNQSNKEENILDMTTNKGLQELIAQLLAEKTEMRKEAAALREELEARRIESEAKLLKRFATMGVDEGNEEVMGQFKQVKLESELELQSKFDSLQRQLDEQNKKRIMDNEEREQKIKEQYEIYKDEIAREVAELEIKNKELQEALNAKNDVSIKSEYDENEKKLREKYMQLRAELSQEAKQLQIKEEEIESEKEVLREEKELLEEEKIRLEDEVKILKKQIELSVREQKNTGEIDDVTLERVRFELQREFEDKERLMNEKIQRERQVLAAKENQLIEREREMATEETRIREESKVISTLMSNREYSVEERERIVLDYSQKLEELQERLRQNEKAIRENNREFIPLHRIKNTLDRDTKILRKREAIVAKQQVLIYGVNNIANVEPERIKKLEADTKQLEGLQQSVANCQMILDKNKDRYPTLENLDRVLRAQNAQIRADIEEVNAAATLFGEDSSEG
ncbi:MAG: hypothetical protein LBH47_00600 [Christensenellaceae bacterium]|jgi:hypothetical protein|nr:hypothetical protein [Christensenellaceae bacterium]